MTSRANTKRFHRSLRPGRIELTARDVSVLEALARHRLLSGDQLRRLVLRCSTSRARRRLRALYDHSLLERVQVVAQPTRGIPPFLYKLAPDGAAVLTERGINVVAGSNGTASLQFLRHRYLVNEFAVTLVECLRGSGHGLGRWLHEQELKVPGPDGRGEVEQVRHASLPRPLPFLPDAFFEIELPSGGSLAYFLEMDLSTHAQRVWRERARLYTAYSDPRAGLFRRRFGRETFRLLIVTPPDFRQRSRCDNVMNTIAETVGRSDIFLAATLAEVTAERLLRAVWRRPGRAGRCSLLENQGRVTVRAGPQAETRAAVQVRSARR